MSDMRTAVSGRRTVEKGKFGIADVLFDAFFKNFVLFPEFENFLFAADEIKAVVNFFVH